MDVLPFGDSCPCLPLPLLPSSSVCQEADSSKLRIFFLDFLILCLSIAWLLPSRRAAPHCSIRHHSPHPPPRLTTQNCSLLHTALHCNALLCSLEQSTVLQCSTASFGINGDWRETGRPSLAPGGLFQGGPARNGEQVKRYNN